MFFNPDPYVKLSVQPGRRISVSSAEQTHHGQNQRTTIAENTIMPSWEEQVNGLGWDRGRRCFVTPAIFMV